MKKSGDLELHHLFIFSNGAKKRQKKRVLNVPGSVLSLRPPHGSPQSGSVPFTPFGATNGLVSPQNWASEATEAGCRDECLSVVPVQRLPGV